VVTSTRVAGQDASGQFVFAPDVRRCATQLDGDDAKRR
jgi:hypothetical protein